MESSWNQAKAPIAQQTHATGTTISRMAFTQNSFSVLILYILYAVRVKVLRITSIPPLNVTMYRLTYLLTPWSRVLLEKLTGSAASQEIPHIFGT